MNSFVLDIIMKEGNINDQNPMASHDKVRGDDTMCQALRELMKDEIDQELEKNTDATKVDAIKNVMKNLKLPAEKAMEILGIAEGDFSKYMAML